MTEQLNQAVEENNLNEVVRLATALGEFGASAADLEVTTVLSNIEGTVTESEYAEVGNNVENAQVAERRISILDSFYTASNNNPLLNLEGGLDSLQGITLEELREIMEGSINTDRLNQSDVDTLQALIQFKSDFIPAIRSRLTSSTNARSWITRRWQNPILHLVQSDGGLPEAFYDVLAANAFNWLMYDSSDAAFNTPEQMARILGADQRNPIYNDDGSLMNAGNLLSTTVSSMTRGTLNSLGLNATNNAPDDFNFKFEQDLGRILISNLSNQGYVDITALDNAYLNGLLDSAGVSTASRPQTGNTQFIRATLDNNQVEDTAQSAQVRTWREIAYRESSRASQALINKSEVDTLPLVNEVPVTPDEVRIGRTDSVLSSTERTAFERIQNRVYKPHQVMFNLFAGGGLGRDFIQDILGYDRREGGTAQGARRRTSINNQIDTAINHAEDFGNVLGLETDITENDIYFPHGVDSNMRKRMTSNTFNPQSNILHRAMLQYGTRRLARKGTKVNRDNMLLGMSLFLDLDPDKQSNTTAIPEVEALLTTPLYADAITEIRKLINDDSPNFDVIRAATFRGEDTAPSHAVLTFRALYDWAEFQEALDNPDVTHFNFPLMFEVDGVTNGPFHAFLQFGVIDESDAANAINGGVLTNSNTRHNHHTNARTNDNYSSVTGVVNNNLKVANIDGRITSVFERFNAKLLEYNEETGAYEATRSLGKGVTTKIVYGAGERSVLTGLFNDHLNHALRDLDAAVIDADTSVAEDDISQAILSTQRAYLVAQEFGELLRFRAVRGEVSERGANPFTLDINSINESNYAQILESLKGDIFTRPQLNQMTDVYRATYGKAITQAVETKFGKVTQTKNFITAMTNMMTQVLNAEYIQARAERIEATDSIFGLTRQGAREVLAAVKRFHPAVRPFFGERGNYTQYQSFTTLSRTVGDTESSGALSRPTLSRGRGENTSANLFEQANAFTDPGVSATPLSTIGMDAANSSLLALIQDNDILDVWDGFFAGSYDLQEVARLLNASDATIQSQYNLFAEFYENFRNVMNGTDLVTLDGAFREFAGNSRQWEGYTGETFANEAYHRAITLTNNKSNLLAGSSYNQFAGVNGSASLINAEGNSTDLPTGLPDLRLQRLTTGQLNTVTPTPFNREGTISGREEVENILDSIAEGFRNGYVSDQASLRIGVIDMVRAALPENVSIQNVDFNTVEFTRNNPTAFGAFRDGVVYINNSVPMGDKKYAETVLHELLHATSASTVNDVVLNNGANSNQTQRNAVKGLFGILRELTRRGVNIAPVALFRRAEQANSAELRADALSELLAYTLSEDATGLELAAQAPTGFGLLKELGSRIRGFFLGLFNRNVIQQNALTEVLSSYYGILTGNERFNEDVDGTIIDNPLADKIETTLYSDDILGSLPEQTPFLRDAMNRLENQVGRQLDSAYQYEYAYDKVEDILTIAEIDPAQDSSTNTLVGALNMNDSQSFVYEAYQGVIAAQNNQRYFSNTQVARIFDSARNQLSASDFFPANLSEGSLEYEAYQPIAQAKYDAIFNNTSTEDPIANFLALTQSDEAFANRVNQVNVETIRVVQERGIIPTIANFITEASRRLSGLIARTSPTGTTANQLRALSNRLTLVRARKKTIVDNLTDNLGTATQVANNLIRSPLSLVARGVRKYTSGTNIYRNYNNIQNALVTSNTEALHSTLNLIANSIEPQKPNGFVTSIAASFIGESDASAPIRALGSSEQAQIESERQNENYVTSRAIRDSFTQELTEEENALVFKGALRADVAILFANGSSVRDVAELLRDPTALQTAIDSRVANLNNTSVSQGTKNFWLNSAYGLARHMITGRTYNGYQLRSAAAIANAVGTELEGDQAATLDIDILTTLVALQNLSNKEQTAELFEREANGIRVLTRVARVAKNRERTKYGQGTEFAQVKGYVADILNPNRALSVVNAKDRTNLLRKGYTDAGEFLKDPSDPSRGTLYVVKSEGAGISRYVRGAMNTVTATITGINPNTGLEGANGLPSYGLRSQLTRINRAKRADINNLTQSFNPSSTPVTSLVPAVGINGEVIGYNYPLDNATKEEFLQQDFTPEDSISSWNARILEEARTFKANEMLVGLLARRWKNAVGSEKNQFVAISARSTNDALRERWNLMPAEMKAQVREQFGGETMYVHASELDNALGQREFSLVNTAYEARDRSRVAALTLGFIEQIYGKPAANILRAGERGIIDAVKVAKDFIVVKSIIVSAVNILSNVVQLGLTGSLTRRGFQDANVAVNSALDYDNTQKSINDLTSLRIASNDNTRRRELTTEINRLQRRLEGNPIHELALAGLRPTTLEDLESTDRYSAAASIKNRLGNYIPDSLTEPNSIIGNLAIFRSSRVYGLLNRSVELGDFVGKYVTYQKLRREGVSQEDALNRARREFVDFGALTNSKMEYLMRVGLLPFWKWKIGVVRIISRIILQSPASVLGFVLGNSLTGIDAPSPLDVTDTGYGSVGSPLSLIRGAFNAHPLNPL